MSRAKIARLPLWHLLCCFFIFVYFFFCSTLRLCSHLIVLFPSRYKFQTFCRFFREFSLSSQGQASKKPILTSRVHKMLFSHWSDWLAGKKANPYFLLILSHTECQLFCNQQTIKNTIFFYIYRYVRQKTIHM